jgi:transposase InsO family protein
MALQMCSTRTLKQYGLLPETISRIATIRRRAARSMLSVRPKIAELMFQVYGRPLHPELFEIFATRCVSRGDYEATINITSAGHVVAWRYRGLTLTEVACSASHPLPQKRRLLHYRLKGHRSDELECRGGVRYEMNFQLEPVRPEVFWTFQQELSADGIRQGMLHRFDSSGRMALGALSYVNVEARNRSLRIQAFHTFPDDYAIVKSESLFAVP